MAVTRINRLDLLTIVALGTAIIGAVLAVGERYRESRTVFLMSIAVTVYAMVYVEVRATDSPS